MDPLIEIINTGKTAFDIYRAFRDEPYSFILDSGMDTECFGRFSFVGVEPFLTMTAVSPDETNVDLQGWKKTFKGNPFSVLDAFMLKYRRNFRAGEFPFWGGAVGWFSYDLKDSVEILPQNSVDDTGLPLFDVGFYDRILVFDHLTDRSYIVSSGLPETGPAALLRAKARTAALKDRLSGAGIRPLCAKVFTSEPVSNFTRGEYIKTVRKAQRYIRKGDIYQANISQRFSTRLDGHPCDLYGIARKVNPAPFAAYLNFGGIQIGSMSPERFMKIDNGHVQTRPIKGTRPRGLDKAGDVRNRDELLSSVKDRAENIMIVDLQRNDLGRICEFGSVRAGDLLKCEEFPTVFHLTSTVEGRLKSGLSPVEALMKCFPGGSITGAPKIRAMEIIDELEGIKRGVYTGSIGYISFNGDMDTSIAIRTFVHKDGELYFGSGGGIVYDSDPAAEYDETLLKAKAFFTALKCGMMHEEAI